MLLICPQCGRSVDLDDLAAACPECGAAFDPEITHEAALEGSAPAPAPQAARETFLHYDALQLLRRTASGETYKGNDPRLHRTVVIKLWDEGRKEPWEANRLLQVARAMSELRHPQIAQLYDCGVAEGRVFVVTEYVFGADLAKWSSRGVPAREAARIAMELAGALDRVHAAGVIHRDVKPDNIIVDPTGRPHLIDFSLARQVDEVSPRERSRLLGTPAYVSPEQARGDGYKADGRSDIYSLGVVLFELLTGRRPFLGVIQDLIRSAIEQSVPPPSRLKPSVPLELDAVCSRCLHKSPQHRYQAARELEADLRSFLQTRERGDMGDRLRAELEARGAECELLRDSLHSLEETTDRRFRQLVLLNDELLKREEEAKAAREAAEEANRAKSQFLANMSHEIRTPLNTVLGMTELVLGMSLPDNQRDMLRVVQQSAESLLAVLNDILDFSRIEAHKLDLVHEPFRLRSVLGDTLKALALRAHAESLELAWCVADAAPEHVVGDKDRLRQVVFNLVNNAIKFTDEGEVVLRVDCASPASAEGVELHFSVSDTGIGVPPDKQESIFRSFEQADASATRRHGGTGLGLSIASELVALMNGQIWLESEPGRGSVFHFTAQFGRDTASLPSIAEEFSHLKGRRVLVVDAHEPSRVAASHWLRMAGVLPEGAGEWRAAEQAIAAAAAANGLPIDCVVANARSLLDASFDRREFVAVAAVVLLTTNTDGPAPESWRDLPTLFKPVMPEELLAAISTALLPAWTRAAAPQTAPQTATGRLHILLVEDGSLNRKMAQEFLERQGHRVAMACDGQQAVDAVFGERAFDVVLMDVQMPVMDGVTATAIIREREKLTGKRVPIIALTAHAMKGDKARFLQAGVDGYVAKPIRWASLFAEIDRVVGGAAGRDPPRFDSDALLAYVGDDMALLMENVQMLAREQAESLGRLSLAVAERDGPRVAELAHKLNGTVAQFHADHARRLAEQLEREGRRESLDGAAELCQTLSGELDRLVSELTAFARERDPSCES